VHILAAVVVVVVVVVAVAVEVVPIVGGGGAQLGVFYMTGKSTGEVITGEPVGQCLSTIADPTKNWNLNAIYMTGNRKLMLRVQLRSVLHSVELSLIQPVSLFALDLLFRPYQFHGEGLWSMPAPYECVSEPGLFVFHNCTPQIVCLDIKCILRAFQLLDLARKHVHTMFKARTICFCELKAIVAEMRRHKETKRTQTSPGRYMYVFPCNERLLGALPAFVKLDRL
jgi:hypothetical protein